MRLRPSILVFGAALVSAPRLASAGDAGDDAAVHDAGDDAPANDAATAPPGDASSDANAGNEAGLDAAATPDIACDGDLCDTLQGRPTCTSTTPAKAARDGATPWICVGVSVLLAGMSRRAARGAARRDGRALAAPRCPTEGPGGSR